MTTRCLAVTGGGGIGIKYCRLSQLCSWLIMRNII